MYKTLFLLLLLVSLRTFISCCREAGYDFRWTKASVRNISFTGNSWQTLSGDSSRRATAGLVLRFDHERLSALPTQNFGTTAALATRCESVYTNTDSFTTINLVTRYDFDATHPAGSSLNDLPMVSSGWAYLDTTRSAYQTPAEVLHSDYGLNQNISPFGSMLFRFSRVNPYLGQHRFVVTLTTVNGRVFTDSVGVVLY